MSAPSELRIKLIKSAFIHFETLIPSKSNSRAVVYHQLENTLLADSRNYYIRMQESWADTDCEGYLKLANELKLREENILQRIFENSSSINYIKDKIHTLFYEIIL